MPPLLKIEDIRRAHIIDSAIIAISVTGAANVTMRDIARAASLSNGGLAHYFRSKDELFKATFKEFFRRVFARSKEELAKIQDPMEKLLAFGAFFDDKDPDVPVGYPLMFDCMSIAVRNEDYRALFDEWLDNWVMLLREAIHQGIEQNVFAGVDPDATAHTISAIYQGISIRWYLARESNSTAWAMAAFKEAINSLMAPYRV
jgi:AcrR family transcriptional regulator